MSSSSSHVTPSRRSRSPRRRHRDSYFLHELVDTVVYSNGKIVSPLSAGGDTTEKNKNVSGAIVAYNSSGAMVTASPAWSESSELLAIANMASPEAQAQANSPAVLQDMSDAELDRGFVEEDSLVGVPNENVPVEPILDEPVLEVEILNTDLLNFRVKALRGDVFTNAAKEFAAVDDGRQGWQECLMMHRIDVPRYQHGKSGQKQVFVNRLGTTDRGDDADFPPPIEGRWFNGMTGAHQHDDADVEKFAGLRITHAQTSEVVLFRHKKDLSK